MEKIKNHIEKVFSGIDFNNTTHTYSRGNKNYISVSKFISTFYKEFDKKKWSSYVAERDGKTVEEVLKEWEEKNKMSLEKGHKIHSFAEKYFYDNNYKPIISEEKAIVRFFNTLDKRYIPLFSEKVLFSDKYKIAGTCDLLLYDSLTKSIVIVDWKTNNDLFKSYSVLLYPFQHLKDSNLNKYKLQLSTYRLMLNEYNVNVSNTIIIWLTSNGEFVSINTESYVDEIKSFLAS